MSQPNKPRLVGINHVALEVGDVDAALAFLGRIFSFELRGRSTDDEGLTNMAFIDMGDQFLALSRGRTQPPDDGRHFGLVVDDRSAVAALAKQAGAIMVDGPFLDFLDPWGNRFEIVEYRDLQFTKDAAILKAMGLALEKTPRALQELAAKGVGNSAAR